MKEIFVFGAGASHASGETPLGMDLVWTYFPDCFEFDNISRNRDKFAPLLGFLKAKPKWDQYAVQLERCIIDRTMCLFDVDKKYYVDELMKDLQKDSDSESIKLIKRLTVEHIAETASEPKTKGLSLYEQFAQILAQRSASDVSIISFNFDCLLHEEFKESNVYMPVCFDYLLDFEEIPENRKFYRENRKTGIPLIKLNGSLDWAYNLKTKKLTLLHWFVKPKTYYSGDEQFEPYIFLPHQQKDELREPLWDRAKAELRQADKITVIGYSFPDYDKDVVDLFRGNVDKNAEWEVIDYEGERDRREESRSEIQNKYERLFPKIQKPAIHIDGFEGYIRRMGKL